MEFRGLDQTVVVQSVQPLVGGARVVVKGVSQVLHTGPWHITHLIKQGDVALGKLQFANRRRLRGGFRCLATPAIWRSLAVLAAQLSAVRPSLQRHIRRPCAVTG